MIGLHYLLKLLNEAVFNTVLVFFIQDNVFDVAVSLYNNLHLLTGRQFIHMIWILKNINITLYMGKTYVFVYYIITLFKTSIGSKN